MSQSFLTTSDIADIAGVTTRAVRAWVERGKIDDRFLHYQSGLGRGGREIKINPLGLPEPYRSQWITEVAKEEVPTASREEIDSELYANLKDYQREHADLWLYLFNRFGDLKGRELKSALNIYMEQNPDVKCSYKTFMRKQKEYNETGLAGIVPDWGKREGLTKVSDQDYELFKSFYLKESRPTATSCWELVRGAAFSSGRDVADFPHWKTFIRRLEAEVPEPAIYLARHGKKAWNKKYANYIDRDKSEIAAGSVWVSDHRQLDIFVLNSDGKPYRPWLTAWYCFKSGKWLSWWLHESAPNSDHVFQTFKWGIEKYGKPNHIYIDNGKDYRCKDFAGGSKWHKMDVDERQARSMIMMLNIEPHFALPYNAQAKNIERGFQNFIQFLEQHLPGYAGMNAQARPESTTGDIKAGRIIEENTFNELFDQFVERKLNRKPSQGKEHQGLSPNELFFKEHTEKRVPRPEALKLFCMRTTPGSRTIGRNGVKDSETGMKYYAAWMAGMKGEKVYLRRDIEQYQEAWVFSSETNEFLGKATLAPRINGLAQTDLEREQVRELNRQKRQEEKIMKSYRSHLDQPSPEEIVQYAIANEDATEKQRKAAGDFLDYDEQLKVSRMKDTRADEIIEQQRKFERTGTDDLDDIAPGAGHKQQLKSIWDEE